MRRFAMEKLEKWKNSKRRKPLIIIGARQVGKTWLMKEFGKKYYKKVAYVSFYNNERMKSVFNIGLGESKKWHEKVPYLKTRRPQWYK